MQTSGASRRENAKLYHRHCERSEAIHSAACRDVDCFAPLAMTRMGRGAGHTRMCGISRAFGPHKILQRAAIGISPISVTPM